MFHRLRYSTCQRLSALVALNWVLWFVVGCDTSRPQAAVQPREASHTTGRLVSKPVTPREILEQTVHSYRSLRSYQDQARVELHYHYDGTPAVDHAPLSVAWEKGGSIGLRAYTVTAGPTQSDRWHLTLGENHPEVAGQILSRRRSTPAELSWLLDEPLVASALASGLAGWPPQLDLLFGDRPLEALVGNQSNVALRGTELIDGQECYRIEIHQRSQTYKMWIVCDSLLIRRLELPSESLPSEILSNSRVSQVRLTIDLAGIRINQGVNWKTFQVPQHSDRIRLSRFVPEPPEWDVRGLGVSSPAFRLRDHHGNIGYSSMPTEPRKATVLIWLADHPGCRAAAQQVQLAIAELKSLGIGERDLEVVSVWAEPQPPANMSFAELQQQWQLPGRLVVDREAAGRDLFQIEEAPTVIVLDADSRLQLRQVRTDPLLDHALAPILERIVRGTDMAEQMRQANAHSQLRFQAELAMAAASDRLATQPTLPDSYPPGNMQLTPVASQSYHGRIACLAQDAGQSPWLLLADGTLYQLDAQLQTLATWDTGWTSTTTERGRLLPASGNRYCAWTTESLDRVEVLQCKTKQSTTFDLPAGSRARDLQWLSVQGSKSPRLAVITTNNKILLLDPENRQQLSADVSLEPIAILNYSTAAGAEARDVNGCVALADGTVQSLHFANPPQSSAAEAPIRRLTFAPRNGPWLSHPGSDGNLTLAIGSLGQELPAAFLLDHRLQQQWQHYLPIALLSERAKPQLACASAPQTGAAVWALLDSSGIIHLFRSDASWTDHFRPKPVASGVALLPSGDRLLLIIASDDQLSAFRLD
ncbi:MAG: hypothetical protein KF752_03265 [Pirellulaceae bacterium]|nr:hypothetical protein [Pirellulaceae bacterium]